MDFDAISAGMGVAAWEVAKQIIGAFFKRTGEKTSGKRKQLGDQCISAKTKISLCLQYAVEYLTSHCSDARKEELGRLLRHDLSLLGHTIQDMNLYAVDLKLTALPASYLVRFRHAITWNIDSKSYKPQPHDAPDVKRAYEAGLAFQEALTRIQLASA